MMAPDIAREARQAITLIKSFSLELAQYSPESQVLSWLQTYRASWIRDAIIEAVYQGRYKVISVEHILSIWKRRGQPVCHFTSGFEKVIAAHLGAPVHLSAKTALQDYHSGSTSENDVSENDISENDINDVAAVGVTVGADEPAALSHSGYDSLSIKAFPVESEETLVEFYQANEPHKELASKNSIAIKVPQFDHAATTPRNELSADRFELISSSNYTRPESMPIQPFRPELRRQWSA